jgi:FtsP/CotA-like multicopper oxidase with cupredoxin domain
MRNCTALFLLLLAPVLLNSCSFAAEQPKLPVIVANDNRQPAGEIKNGVLILHLELRPARWFAEESDGVYEDGYAFSEQGHPPQSPGPLVRVPQGTRIHASIHNFLPLAAKIYGLNSHPAVAEKFIQVNAGETREVQFDAGMPGTYLYWATTSNAHLDRVEERQGEETLLTGALVVDSPGARDDDRIFVIVDFDKQDFAGGEGATVLAINGKSWPATERLTYKIGEPIRWRVINATSVTHAMHLHGFFFTVDGVGNAAKFVHYPEAQRRKVVTEGISPGHSFDMSWTPDRAGNWLFHCHMILHMSPSLVLHPTNPKPAADLAEHDHSAGMGGMVMGITVLPSAATNAPPAETRNPRKLQLVVSENPGKIPLYRLDLNDPATAQKPEPEKQPALLGPPIILTRGEPVEIEVKNQSSNATAIHWHGIELESYFDGVPGWSGSGTQITPPVAPGTSFVARFTPPRAGTFIYHSHAHDEAAIHNGLYGPLIVLEPGQKFDADADRVFLVSVGVYSPLGFMMLINGRPAPDPLFLRTGKHYRFRLINITDEGADLHVRLTSRTGTTSWKVVAKDGADLPPTQVVTTPADIALTVGSTCDVDVTLENSGLNELEMSSNDLLSETMYPLIALPK